MKANFWKPTLKKIAKASGVKDYNLLQNNGSIAHQVVPHVSQCPSM